jgi:hypothetical protein
MKKRRTSAFAFIIPVCVLGGAVVWWALAMRPVSPAEWFRGRKAEWDRYRLAGQCVRELKWLETASANEAVQKDAASKQYRFYSCFGSSWNTPGIEFIDYVACYKSTVRIQEIEGTRDRALSAKHERMMDLAYRFAREYNGLMRDWLMRNGMSRCGAGEQWGRAFSELSFALGDESGPGGTLGMPVAFDVSKPSFEIAIRDRSKAGAVRAAAGECFFRNGILRRVDFHLTEVTRVKDHDRQTPIGSFTCENGKIVKIR